MKHDLYCEKQKYQSWIQFQWNWCLLFIYDFAFINFQPYLKRKRKKKENNAIFANLKPHLLFLKQVLVHQRFGEFLYSSSLDWSWWNNFYFNWEFFCIIIVGFDEFWNIVKLVWDLVVILAIFLFSGVVKSNGT